MTVVPVQRTTSTESSTGPSTIVEFVHFSMLTALNTYEHRVVVVIIIIVTTLTSPKKLSLHNQHQIPKQYAEY